MVSSMLQVAPSSRIGWSATCSFGFQFLVPRAQRSGCFAFAASYTAERQLFAVLTGHCGTRKTTTIRRFVDRLDRGKFQVLYLSDSTPRHFYKGMLESWALKQGFIEGMPNGNYSREIELMKGIHDIQPVVVVDEAHLLDREMLEEVRFLLNFKMDAQSPMALILVGQSELWDRLRLQSFAAIRQRIDLQCRLGYYDRAQVDEYVAASSLCKSFLTVP